MSQVDQEREVARFERTCKGGLVGCGTMLLALAILGLPAGLLTGWLIQHGWRAPHEATTGLLALLFLGGPACLVCGAIGARYKRSFLVIALGTLVLASAVAVLIAWSGTESDPLAWEFVLLILGFGSLCSLATGSGILVTRSVPLPGEPKQSFWPSRREWCVALVLLVILLGYLAHILTVPMH
jgi:hypothetical protein